MGVDTLLLASSGAEMARWCLTCACEAGDCLGGVGAAAGGMATVGAGGAMGFGGRGDTIGPTAPGPGQWPPAGYEYDPDYDASGQPDRPPRTSPSLPGADLNRWQDSGRVYTRGTDGGYYYRDSPRSPVHDALLRWSESTQRWTETWVDVDVKGTAPGGSKA